MTYNERLGPSTSSSSTSSTQVDNRVVMHTVVPLSECPHLVEVCLLLLQFFKLMSFVFEDKVLVGIFGISFRYIYKIWEA